jgi:hypothetical protein
MEAQLLVSFFHLLTHCFHPAISVAYDLKLLIDKGIYDVLKPNWVTDSIALGQHVPFRKKYNLSGTFTSFNSRNLLPDTFSMQATPGLKQMNIMKVKQLKTRMSFKF